MNRTTMLRKAVFLWVLIILGAAPVMAAQAGSPGELKGPAFTNPAETQSMPAEWVSRPIVHDEDSKGADLVVSLNQQFYNFIEPIVKRFAEENGLDIRIIYSTCGLAASMLSRKQLDIGGFCCPPGKTDRLPGIQFHTIGIHPLSIIVHPDNPVDDLSQQQLREIFRGEIYRWSDLGWRDIPIQPVGRLHCKSRPGHWRLILDNEDLFSPGLREVSAIEDMFSLVSSTPGAIGHEVMWLSERLEGKVKPIKIDSYDPEDLDNLLNGKYPFYRALYLTTWRGPGVENPNADKLVEFITREVEGMKGKIAIIPASSLRDAGWKFRGGELVGEPGQE